MKEPCNQGLDKLLQNLAASECTLIPAYIAYGLLQNMVMEPSSHSERADKCQVAGKDRCSPQDPKLHEELLRKLALHLAAQPDAESDSLPKSLQSTSVEHAPSSNRQKIALTRSGDCAEGSRQAKEAKDRSLSPQEQEFQQEMLRKLALHLAAQEMLDGEERHDEALPQSVSEAGDYSVSDSVCEKIVTPEVFPATPSSMGEEHCEHYYIGDDQCDHHVEETCCQCVWVPVHLLQGLLGGTRGSKDRVCKDHKQAPCILAPPEQEFHQQMLQKLALHLAAQSEPLQGASTPEQLEDAPSLKQSRCAWADMTDDDELPVNSVAVTAKVELAGFGKVVQDRPRRKDTQEQGPLICPKPAKVGEEQFHKDMLQKIALHLAAQPDDEKCVEKAAAQSTIEDFAPDETSEVKAFGNDKARCDQLIAELEPSLNHAMAVSAKMSMEWSFSRARALSLTPGGCRVVQKLIDLSSAKQHEQILDVLLQDFTETYTSPHANHVIAKLAQSMPAKSLARIGVAMDGKATTVARHQFGSRILERLIEHCSENDIDFLLDDLLEDIEPLARHQFGNFVVASLLEHAAPARKSLCMQKLLPYVLQHATHKTACNIVQRMLDHADLNTQAMIADVFLAGKDETSLETIASTRYGSFVIQHLVDRIHPRIDAVKARIKAAHSQLKTSGFSHRKIVQFLGEGFFRD